MKSAQVRDRPFRLAFRGLKKNHDHLCAAFALVNIYQHRKQLARPTAQCARRPLKTGLRQEENNQQAQRYPRNAK